MPRFGVTMPVAGSVYVEVEAENEEAAIGAAFGAGSLVLSGESTNETDELVDLEVYRNIVSGNVCHVPTTSPEVRKL